MDFGAQARPAHPQQKDVRESALSYVLGELDELIGRIELRFDDIQPAEPLALIGAGPQRGVLGPQTRDFVAAAPGVAPIGERALQCRVLIRTQRERSWRGHSWS